MSLILDMSASQNSSRWRWVVACIVTMTCGIAVIGAWSGISTHQTMPVGVPTDDYKAAKKAFEKAHKYTADRNDILQTLAERAIADKRLETAANCFAMIPSTHPTYGRMARYGQAVTLEALHRAVDAEQQLRELISLESVSRKIKPEYLVYARQRLRHILETELRFEERHQLLRGVIERGEEQSYEPIVACFPSLTKWNCTDAILWIEHFHANNPEDPSLNVALGRFRTAQGRLTEAKEILESVLQRDPANLPALAALLACLRESDNPEELTRIFQSLPAQTAEDPWQLLLQRGALSLQNDNPAAAATAYEQLLKKDRTCIEAWQGLAQATRLLDDSRKDRALKMSGALGRIQSHLGKAIQEPTDASSFLAVAHECAEVSLNREGAIMTRCAQRLLPRDPEVLSAVKLFRERLATDHEQPLLGK